GIAKTSLKIPSGQVSQIKNYRRTETQSLVRRRKHICIEPPPKAVRTELIGKQCLEFIFDRQRTKANRNIIRFAVNVRVRIDQKPPTEPPHRRRKPGIAELRQKFFVH